MPNHSNSVPLETLAGGVSFDDFESFCLYRAFDLISEGSYRRLVVNARENSEPWAMQSYTGMQNVSSHTKRVISTVNSLSEYGKTRLHAVCSEVIGNSTPPCKAKLGWGVCLVTGVRSDRCLDLTRPGKSEGLVVVSAKFSHFLIMLWFIAKLEHVCKTVAKVWLVEKGESYEKENTVHQICVDFSNEKEQIKALHEAYNHACQHVVNSINIYRTTPEFGTQLGDTGERHNKRMRV